ncbi:MAG: chemotaxis protein CheW [Lachnospiraceae bacterium]|nr:chemotaxis protein CheW [Lachnospiraceae bacterium]
MDEQALEMNKEEERITQYIVIKIDNEQYGIDIKYIDNIVRMEKITRVPKAQRYFKGVINLRGEVIPVMDLRVKFDMEEMKETKDTRIIILKLDKQSTVGIIVDAVREVVSLKETDMEKVAANAADSRTQYISVIGKHENELISIINIISLVSEEK